MSSRADDVIVFLEQCSRTLPLSEGDEVLPGNAGAAPDARALLKSRTAMMILHQHRS